MAVSWKAVDIKYVDKVTLDWRWRDEMQLHYATDLLRWID